MFQKFQTSSEVLELAAKCLKQEYDKKYGDIEQRIDQVNNEIKKEQQKLNRLLDLYISGVCSEEIYKKKTSEIEYHIDELNIRMRSYNKSGVDILHYSTYLFELLKNAVALYKNADVKKKRILLNLICSNFLKCIKTLVETIKEEEFQLLINQILYFSKLSKSLKLA